MDALLLLVPRDRRDRPHRARAILRWTPTAGWRAGRASSTPARRSSGRTRWPTIEDEVFSLNLLWDRMLARRAGCSALCIRGGWCDVGHPGGIAAAEAMLAGTPMFEPTRRRPASSPCRPGVDFPARGGRRAASPGWRAAARGAGPGDALSSTPGGWQRRHAASCSTQAPAPAAAAHPAGHRSGQRRRPSPICRRPSRRCAGGWNWPSWSRSCSTAQPDLAPRAAIYDLADSLAGLMDEMQGEGVDPDAHPRPRRDRPVRPLGSAAWPFSTSSSGFSAKRAASRRTSKPGSAG